MPGCAPTLPPSGPAGATLRRVSASPAHPFRSEKARERYLAQYDRRSAAWPLPSTTRMVDTSFGQTFVRTSGPPGAQPLVLLPGIGSPGHTFSQNVPDLADRFAVHAVDNIHDNGRSIELESNPVKDTDDFTRWLDEVLTGLGLGEAVDIVGLSYGGWLAANYALRYPKRVRRLVLLAPAGILAPIGWSFVWRALLCLLPCRCFMRSFMAWSATDMQKTPAQIAKLDEMVDDAYLAIRSFKSRRMVPPMPLADEQWRQLTVPTLLVAGTKEVFFPAEESLARVGVLVPTMERHLIPGAGHDLFVARAAEVDARIVEFLDRK